jgi:glycosyltransferase involved in cell wall biosynthesis
VGQITDRAARPSAQEAPAAEGGRQRQAVTAGYVSIIMPCLNEEDTVAVCVRKAVRWLSGNGVDGEVIVVDNGSSDSSAERAAQAGARVVHEPIRGYGSALIRGLSEARGEFLIMGDCDDTYDFSNLDEFLSPLHQGYDLVIGDRYSGGIRPGAMTWSHRYIGTPIITLLLRVMAAVRVGDSQCGLRALTRSALERLGLRCLGMEFASEMILKASRQGLRIAEVPIPYYARASESKLSTMRDGWRHVRFLLLASPNYLFTVPGVLLSLAGVLSLGLILASSNGIQIGPLNWQPVFAGTIFLVVGMNSLLLGFASRLYTTAKGITNEDFLLRFYRKYLGLESLILAGVVLVFLGIGTDVYLIFAGPEEGSAGVNWLHISAIAQALVISGANLVLVGALAGLLETE